MTNATMIVTCSGGTYFDRDYYVDALGTRKLIEVWHSKVPPPSSLETSIQ